MNASQLEHLPAALEDRFERQLRDLTSRFGTARVAALVGVSRQSVLKGLARLPLRATVRQHIETCLSRLAAEGSGDAA